MDGKFVIDARLDSKSSRGEGRKTGYWRLGEIVFTIGGGWRIQLESPAQCREEGKGRGHVAERG